MFPVGKWSKGSSSALRPLKDLETALAPVDGSLTSQRTAHWRRSPCRKGRGDARRAASSTTGGKLDVIHCKAVVARSTDAERRLGKARRRRVRRAQCRGG